jgi:hypothetical protein
MADTLSELLSNVAAFKKGSETATRQVIGILGQQAERNAEITDIFKQQAADDTTIMAAKTAAELETQLSRVKAANALGTNLKSSTEVVTKLAADSNAAYEAKDAALKEYEKKKAINFLDNPVEYVKAQLLINRDISAHNVANAQMQQAEKRIATINALTQTTVATQNAISEPLTAAAAAAATRNAAVAANVNARKSDIDTLNYSVRAIEVALNSSKEVLALDFQAQGAKNAAASLALQQENAAQSRIEFSYRQKEYQERAADKQAQDDMGRSVVDTVNLGRRALLGDKGTPLTDIDGKMVINALKSKGVLSDEYKVFYEAGNRSRIAGKVMIGSTPAQAATTLQAMPDVQLNPTQAPIKQILGQAMSDTAAGIGDAGRNGKAANAIFNGVDPKNKEAVSSAYNARVRQIMGSYEREINPADASNPYQIASINQLYANSPTVRELPVIKKVFEPLIKSGQQITDPKQIMFMVSEAVSKGKITHKEALEVSTIYHVGVKANMAMRNFDAFGIQPSMKYNAKIEINPNSFVSSEIVDLTKPDAVSRALMKIQAGAMHKDMMGRRNNINDKPKEFRNPIFDDRGVAPDSMFQPNPKAANALDAAADSVGPAVENFFKNLPRASDFENKATGNERRRISGKITPAQGQ